MKQQIGFYLFAAAAMLLIPGTVLLLNPDSAQDAQPPSAITSAPKEESSQQIQAETKCYRVLDISSGTVLEVPVRDYLIGVVCAEMPATFESEALKAQAVAAHTYAERIRLRNLEHNNPALLGADFSNDSNLYQAYYTESQIRTAFGDAFDLYYGKIEAAVDAVCTELLYYEEEPIVAAFHAMSAGQTENAETVWGSPLAYLVSVDSKTDTTAPRYQETVSLTAETVRQILLAQQPDAVFAEDPSQWFAIKAISEAGTVLTVQGGSLLWSGQQLRELFSLRSACFTIAYAQGQFTFTTKGYGHGVGMSQYGANAMAQSGSTYEEILAHYYPGVTLGTI